MICSIVVAAQTVSANFIIVLDSIPASSDTVKLEGYCWIMLLTKLSILYILYMCVLLLLVVSVLVGGCRCVGMPPSPLPPLQLPNIDSPSAGISSPSPTYYCSQREGTLLIPRKQEHGKLSCANGNRGRILGRHWDKVFFFLLAIYLLKDFTPHPLLSKSGLKLVCNVKCKHCLQKP
jgi:hypothetical protein